MTPRQAILQLIFQHATEPHAIRFLRNQFKLNHHRAKEMLKRQGIQFSLKHSEFCTFTPHG